VTLFARDGCIRIPGFLAQTEVDEIRKAVARLGAARSRHSCERPNNTLVPLCWDDEAVGVVLRRPSCVQLVRSACAATDLRWISGYLSAKEAHSGALWWHQDWWCWDHPVSFRDRAPQVALLCYLHDTTDTSGALRVLPGSHRASAPLHAQLPELHRAAADSSTHESPALRDQPGQRTFSVRTGDAVLLDYRVLHGTHPNESAGRRDCLILNFAPDWDRLPDDVRAHLIGSPGLPSRADRAEGAAGLRPVLPDYAGQCRDLPLCRDAPRAFALASD